MRYDGASRGAEGRARLRRLRIVGLLAIGALIGVYLEIAAAWSVPAIFPILYGAVSLIAFVAYAIDKNAAQRGRWRTKESTLLFLGLAFGWPGAILGQLLLRHKTQKGSFQGAFWLTVLVNLGLFVYLCSPEAPPEVRDWLASVSHELPSMLP